MSDVTKTLGLVLAGVVVILFYVAVTVSGGVLGSASPLSFMIYVGDLMTFSILALIVYMSLGRTGNTD